MDQEELLKAAVVAREFALEVAVAVPLESESEASRAAAEYEDYLYASAYLASLPS